MKIFAAIIVNNPYVIDKYIRNAAEVFRSVFMPNVINYMIVIIVVGSSRGD